MRGVGVCIDIWVDVDGGATEVEEGKGEAVDEGGWDTKAIASGIDEDSEDVWGGD